jgi:hypothetical protein
MMKGIKLIAAIWILAQPAFAATQRSGSAFLRLDSASRPAAMGSAYTAVSGDVDGLAYNPAGLAALKGKQASFSHAEWLVGSRYEHLAYGQSTALGTFSLSAIRLGYGDIEGRDASRQPTGNFSAYDAAYTLGYANRIASGLGLGGAVKIIDRKIASDHASSYAVDIGLLGRVPGKPFWLGASVLNIGPGTRFIEQTDPLPLTFALGAAYKPSRTMKLTVDLKDEPTDQTITAMTGMEYKPVSYFSLRTGYQMPFSDQENTKTWDLNNLRGGAGIQIAGVGLDYAVAPFGELGVTHRFTLSIKFGPSKDLSADDSSEILAQ